MITITRFDHLIPGDLKVVLFEKSLRFNDVADHENVFMYICARDQIYLRLILRSLDGSRFVEICAFISCLTLKLPHNHKNEYQLNFYATS